MNLEFSDMNKYILTVQLQDQQEINIKASDVCKVAKNICKIGVLYNGVLFSTKFFYVWNQPALLCSTEEVIQAIPVSHVWHIVGGILPNSRSRDGELQKDNWYTFSMSLHTEGPHIHCDYASKF